MKLPHCIVTHTPHIVIDTVFSLIGESLFEYRPYLFVKVLEQHLESGKRRITLSENVIVALDKPDLINEIIYRIDRVVHRFGIT